jgi:hypothetical protein
MINNWTDIFSQKVTKHQKRLTEELVYLYLYMKIILLNEHINIVRNQYLYKMILMKRFCE